MKNLVMKCAAVVVGLIVSSGAAFAGTISYDQIVSPQSTSFNVDVALQKFDPTLGTLTGVTISFTADIIANIVVSNSLLTQQSFSNATASVPVTVTGPGSSTASGTAVAGPASGTVGPAVQYTIPVVPPFNVTVPTQTTVSGLTAQTSGSHDVSSADFALYEGSGGSLVHLTFSGNSGTFAGSGVNGVSFGGSATAGGDVKITYTYTASPPPAVPEPSTFALLGLGSLGLAVGAYRRRSVAV